ncbi:putative rOrf6, partial [Escherichia coli 89.0511]
TLVF